ncbi:hypothetical protein MTP04_22260 [Lysinibacillus sp. PLM2]|nr:hypothetical protein MTP04_22260 [Lysinibacillus sp. PLM2]
MKEQLLKMIERNQLVDMMYFAKSGEISKRRIKVISVSESTFKAYCFTKHASRTFTIDNVLSMFPVIRKEREVI